MKTFEKELDVCVAVRCRVLQCVALQCVALQCVAVSCFEEWKVFEKKFDELENNLRTKHIQKESVFRLCI